MVVFNFIIINSSFFYFFICILISLLLSFLLYRKHNSLSNVPLYLRCILFFLRFLAFSILFLLLFEPELQKKEYIEEPPKIVFLQDNSVSITLNSDSTYYKTNYLNLLDSLISSGLNIDLLSFDQVLQNEEPTYLGKMTN